ncbi:hypothetical protein PFLUV_G00235310 [Perca fluviatilis]|uniref:Uncharacterized protein n=1 Tax=Perca fluviatilis TaxID=8168 RepID=A0A6A5DR66_PERFL|nr:hypothetical protein PFLUV_G00235310 [Perca fluviatilis]
MFSLELSGTVGFCSLFAIPSPPRGAEDTPGHCAWLSCAERSNAWRRRVYWTPNKRIWELFVRFQGATLVRAE